MSFCTDVKNELTALRPSRCCKPSLIYGFMLFSRSFCLKRISMQTVNKNMAEYYIQLLQNVYKVNAAFSCGGEKRKTYKAEVLSQSDRLKILASVDFGMCDTLINTGIFLRECCSAAFIRGAFLACGNISDPEKEYRVEFLIKEEKLADELKDILALHQIFAKKSSRAGNTVIYIKESGMVEDFLTLIGASSKSLDIMDTKIIKGVKNNINRARNCDSANISKTVEASIIQRTAIDYLAEIDRLESLPDELLSAAVLRRNNPDSTLKELCRISNEPITVSGLNHRLQKIVALYEELKKGNHKS